MRKLIALFLSLVLSFTLSATETKATAFKGGTHEWAKNMIHTMPLEKKIGQLLILPSLSKGSPALSGRLEELIEKYGIGGVIFMGSDAENQIQLCNLYQKSSEVPLLICQDAEWGVNMRLPACMRYPKNLTLGAIQDNTLIFDLGKQIGQECLLVGVRCNFAPVVDININPQNPIINARSFGENKMNVALKGLAYANGLQSQSVIACCKHFPGHGDVSVDPHVDLPISSISLERLESIELYPFRILIQGGVQAVMSAHILFTQIDKNEPASLSPILTRFMLKKQLGFKGLVFTDALNMDALAKKSSYEEVAIKALVAGNDCLLFAHFKPEAIERIFNAVPTIIEKVKQAVKQGLITEQEIDQRVESLLFAKEWLGLNKKRFTPQKSVSDLNTEAGQKLCQKLFDAAMTLVKNEDELIPLSLKVKKVAFVQVGSKPSESLDALCEQLCPDKKHFYLSSASSEKEVKALVQTLKNYDTVIAFLYETQTNDRIEERHALKSFGFNKTTIDFLQQLQKCDTKVGIVLFGNPYHLCKFGQEQAILVAYENTPEAERSALKVITGELTPKGKLPITASKQFPEGAGL